MSIRVYENTFDTRCDGCNKVITGGPKKTLITIDTCMLDGTTHVIYLCRKCVRKSVEIFKAEDKKMGIHSWLRKSGHGGL